MMMFFKRHVPTLVLSVCLSVFLPQFAFAESPPPNAKQPDSKSLVIGKISSNPKKHYKFLKPIADYAVSKMSDLGYSHAQVVMAKDKEEMAAFLRAGKVDWVTETPFSAMILKNSAGAELLLRKWKKQVPEYHTVFFARRDSGIESLSDLAGKVVAFQDDGSTSAYYIPAYLLIQDGQSLARMPSHTHKPDAGDVGYLFAGKEINMSTWVHKGIVDAGAFSNLDWDKADNTPEFFRKDFVIFHQSQSYPRAIELVRKDLPHEVKTRLKEVLLKIHEDPSAKNILKAYQKTKKFDRITPDMLSVLEETDSIISIVDKTLN